MISRIVDALVILDAWLTLPPDKFELFQRGHTVTYTYMQSWNLGICVLERPIIRTFGWVDR